MGALIAYFPGGENYVSGKLKELSVGNTEVAAGMLQQLTGRTCFNWSQSTSTRKAITPVSTKPRRTSGGRQAGAKAIPERAWTDMTPSILDIPTIGGRCPCRYSPFWSISTFPEKPFSPSAPTRGSGLGRSERDIKRLCPGASVKPGLALHGGSVRNALPALQAWLGN